jgi:hypothetical protein
MNIENEPRWTWEQIGEGPHTLRIRRHHCEYGDYPWDHWYQRAKAAGLGDVLAELGRAVMREADQHAWSEDLQAECGWKDDGAAMLALALDDPQRARERWQWLMDTDGG